jgi:hypothetical protein
MMKEPLPVYNTESIVWTGHVGLVKASDLKDFRLIRVHKRHEDFGCWFQSYKTGRKVLFTVVERVHDNEGELTEWKLASYGLLSPVIITVLND